MEIIDHGVWVRYTPPKPPKDAPLGAMFARRESDGTDWYDYVRPNFLLLHTNAEAPPEPNFQPGSVICNVYHHAQHDKYIVGAATRDPTAVHAINQRVIEITGYRGSDPQKDFGGKVYEHVSKTFSEKPEFQPPRNERLDALEKRIEALEARSK